MTRELVEWKPVRIEPCACGGLLRANPNDERNVREEAERHNASFFHRAWRERRGL